ncbi:hypothetical protein HPB49_009235 [Dermacentor silvarum]|uniref:Uncharacterized protein n=1 Tax=Dermacentor silvarum TaxID=543639 RepID=A0ACB8DYL2_DERSI|nr:hypothetical protein HPB49_009235 [Dermacentor silvarum]
MPEPAVFSVKLLLDTINQYPVLYDESHPRYKEADYKKERWKKIAQDLGVTGHNRQIHRTQKWGRQIEGKEVAVKCGVFKSLEVYTIISIFAQFIKVTKMSKDFKKPDDSCSDTELEPAAPNPASMDLNADYEINEAANAATGMGKGGNQQVVTVCVVTEGLSEGVGALLTLEAHELLEPAQVGTDLEQQDKANFGQVFSTIDNAVLSLQFEEEAEEGAMDASVGLDGNEAVGWDEVTPAASFRAEQVEDDSLREDWSQAVEALVAASNGFSSTTDPTSTSDKTFEMIHDRHKAAGAPTKPKGPSGPPSYNLGKNAGQGAAKSCDL